jgi:hypothetical protein
MPDDPPDRVPPDRPPPTPERSLPPSWEARPLRCHPLDGRPREWTVVSHPLTDTAE